MDKERQIFQLHKKGYEDIAKGLKDLKPNPEAVQKVEFAGVNTITLKGDPGEKGDPGKTPEKGVDYFTAEEIKEISDDIFSRIEIPEPIPGKDAVVDYVALKGYILDEVSKIKVPESIPGKDAVVDYKSIVETVLGKIPKTEVDHVSIKEIIVEHIRKMEERIVPRYRTLNSGGPTTRLGELVDVDIDGVTDGQVLVYNATLGRWVPGAGGGGGGTWGSITGTLSNQIDLQTALDDLVPYTGATANVDLGGFDLIASNVLTGSIKSADGLNTVLDITGSSMNDTGGTVSLDFSSQGIRATRLVLGGGADDGANDLQLQGTSSLIISSQIRMGFYFGILDFGNTAFSPTSARVNFWSRVSSGTIQNDDVLTYDSASQTWYAKAPSGGGGGVTTMGAFGSSPNGNGGSISGVTLTLQPANATNPGGVSTTTQSFLGTKTFLNAINYLNSSATANTVFDGLLLNNSTAASAGNQQYSPRTRKIGYGWKTNATAASQSVEFGDYVIPVQGAANPTGTHTFYYSINGAAATNVLQLNSSNQVLHADGTVSLPSITFMADPDTGWYRGATGSIFSSNNGVNTFGVDQNSVYVGTMGINSTQFAVHPSAGSKHGAVWRARNATSIDYWNFQNDSATQEASLFRTNAAAGKWSLRLNADTAAAPAYSFYGDNNTGFYTKAADDIGLSTGGTLRMNWTTTAEVFSDGYNTTFGTTTGTKIGTATTQKIGFWNATPIVQPTTAVAAATFVANTSGIANDTATFDGYTIGQVVKALRNAGLLA